MTKKIYPETSKSILGCSIFHYSENILSSLVVICMEGPECKNCDAFPAMTLWNDAVKSRRPNQARKHIYKKRNKKKRPTMLMDQSESDIDESESEMDESQIDIDSDE